MSVSKDTLSMELIQFHLKFCWDSFQDMQLYTSKPLSQSNFTCSFFNYLRFKELKLIQIHTCETSWLAPA